MGEVVAPESEVDESESIRMESSETNALEGVVVAAIGKINKERVFDIVVKNGGVAHKDANLTRRLTTLLLMTLRKKNTKEQRNLVLKLLVNNGLINMNKWLVSSILDYPCTTLY